MKTPKYKLKQVIIGEYVATPIKNAFNNKIAYWLSKDGIMLSIYMFTVEDCFGIRDFEERLTAEGLKPYIAMFEEQMKRKIDENVYKDIVDNFDFVKDEKPIMKSRTVVVKRTFYDYVSIDAKTDKSAISTVAKAYDEYEEGCDIEFSIKQED